MLACYLALSFKTVQQNKVHYIYIQKKDETCAEYRDKVRAGESTSHQQWSVKNVKKWPIAGGNGSLFFTWNKGSGFPCETQKKKLESCSNMSCHQHDSILLLVF